MTRTDDDLRDAVDRYRDHLIGIGTKLGTANVYVGQVARFVDWLTHEDNASGVRAPKPSASRTPRVAMKTTVRNAGVPSSLRDAIATWKASGRQPQAPMAWRRDRWITDFPQHSAILEALPDRLGRHDVRTWCANAATDRSAAEAAYLVTMVWGYGIKGYGRPRTAKVLGNPDAAGRLLVVARTLAEDGAVAAYHRLGTDQRLRGLGPAFGTKFLHFCQPSDDRPRALIHDEFVASWLRAVAGISLSPLSWSTQTYSAYLDLLHGWAMELDCEPDEAELAIFLDAASGRQSPWAR